MYQVLYRKYRPKKFEDVVGQEIVVKTLTNAIINNKISHSYIFYGPRGTGKTSLAKMMARSINCDHLDGKLLCEKCQNCQISKDSECIDIIEIDAASNNGVDEIRELKSKVNLVPSSLKYKIYIIDEVHMLSIGAFNALLKTIEEPPEHCIFILATTDVDKVPETIISRCQTFSFERVSIENIVKRLEYVSSEEKIKIDNEVLYEIAKISEGGMRDSLVMLDKLSIYKNDKITLKDFYELNSLLTDDQLNDFIELLWQSNIEKILEISNKYFQEGKNIIQITNQLIYKMTDMIVDFYLKRSDYSVDKIKKIEYLANYLNNKLFDLKKCGNPNIFFEIMILDALNKNDSTKIVETKENKQQQNSVLVEKEERTNRENSKVMKESTPVSKNNKINYDYLYEVNEIRINNALAEASKEELLKNKNLFSKFGDFAFDTKIGYLICNIMDSKIRVASSRNVVLSYDYDSTVKHNIENIEKLQKVYNKVTGLNVKLALTTDEKFKKYKEEYIKNKKNGIIYEYKEEPKISSKKQKNDKESDVSTSSIVEMFGDVVEYE